MAKNKAKSENLLNSIARIDYLLQEGFTRKQLADKLDIQYGTLGKIIRGFSKDIKDENYNKIKKLHLDYIINRTNNLLDDEPVIDSEAAEEEAKELEKFLAITFAIIGILLVGFIFLIKYIISLF